ncbi:undecaprenyl-phosphate glucose phosphotransferase [Geitlerinema splendidum]|nr:undecaprenyl-phosphate glucose phosphotransferase [Geitlerinema splendidum]
MSSEPRVETAAPAERAEPVSSSSIEQTTVRQTPMNRRAQQMAHRSSARLKFWLNSLVYLTDIGMLCLAFVLGYIGRMELPLFAIPSSQPQFVAYLPTMLLHVSTIVALFYFSRMYHQRRSISRIDQARDILGAVTIGAFLTNGIQELIFKNTSFDAVDYPRSMFFYVWFFSILMVIIGRELNRQLRRRLRAAGFDRDNLLIVGLGKVASDIADKIKGSPELGYNIIGLVSVRNHQKPSIKGIPVLGDSEDLPYLIDAYKIEQVIIALPDASRSELYDLVSLSRRGRVDIKIYPDMFAYVARDLSVDDLDGTALITVRDISLRGWKLSFKRMMDAVGAVVGLVLLSPWMLLTALLIRLESPGPIFYTQERMGLDGRPFQMIKFRSMRQDAEKDGAGWTVKGDERVTRIGRFMRATSWDEIPQLINVLLGEMSLVGPRPERPIYVRQFRESIPRYMERHREKSGMTGWAQVNGLRGDTSIAERTQHDLWYVENWSVWLDIKIILRTILNIVLRRDHNAY